MQYQVTEGVATLTFDRPARANALDIAGWHALREVLTRAHEDPEVKVIVLRGAGRHFCAGIDLSVLQELKQRITGTQEEIREQLYAFITDLQDCINAIERCRQPVIAAVHGSCIGGGVDIITACDMRYATKDATFSVKEVDLGIVADLGTLQRLPRIVAPGIAAELSFTARSFDGKEAGRMGLVNEYLGNQDQLNFRVGQVAVAIAAKPRAIVAGIKQTLLHQRRHTVAEGLDFVAHLSSGLMAGMAK